MNQALRRVSSIGEDIVDGANQTIRDARLFLASPQGQHLRANVARGLVAVAPAIAGMPLLRRSPIVRLLGAAGAATMLVKVAEAIRDWEPSGTL